MQHIKVTFSVPGQEVSDMLTALLADAGYDGFEEAGDVLLAYIVQSNFDEIALDEIAQSVGVSYTTEVVQPQNWNALWESNFEPVIVDDFCTIRADFHQIAVTTPYEIVITPKMSFGTGHHATTQLVMRLMRECSFTGKTVLDFGTGTGVLAILAEKLGAEEVLAIDNDEWCVENANENLERNLCRHIQVQAGSLESIGTYVADIILANINRHILLHYMPSLYERLKVGGTIIMSGLLAEDKSIITDAASSAGFGYVKMLEQKNWLALMFYKK